MARSDGDWDELGFKIGTVFRPATPVNRQDLFAGRKGQIRKVIDTINQPGQHALLFGERGVGKTSLANMLFPTLVNTGGLILIPQINCVHGDSFSTIWKRVFDETLMKLQELPDSPEFDDHEQLECAADPSSPDVTPDLVRKLLNSLGRIGIVVLVIDEFDIIDDHDTRMAMSDTLKYLSDRNTPATVVLIGVADDASNLIENHRSVERCLRQIQLPRMERDESEEVVTTGLAQLQMKIDDPALHEISRLSRGLPHYAHLLGLHAGRVAIDRKSMTIKGTDMPDAVSRSVDDTQASVQREYITAVTSARKDAQYRPVLLAAALANCDELGFFYSSDVKPTFSRVMKKPSRIDSFAKPLNAFCTEARGCVLQRDDRSARPRYRFSNPLLQPYVLIRGLAENLLTEDDLKETRSSNDKLQMKLF